MHNDFDNKIKHKCQLEPDITTEEYKKRLNIILKNLPLEEIHIDEKPPKKGFTKAFLAASVLIIVLSVATLGIKVNNSNQMARNDFYFELDKTKSVNGISYTIKNVSVKDNTLLISTILESNSKFNDVIKRHEDYEGTNDFDLEVFKTGSKTEMWISINGGNYIKINSINTEIRLENDYRISFNQELQISNEYSNISSMDIQIRNALDLGCYFNFANILDKNNSKL